MIQTSCRRAGYRPVGGQVCGEPPTPLGGRRWQGRVRSRIGRQGIPTGTPLSEATPGYVPLIPLIRRDAFHRGQPDKESGRWAEQTGRNGQPPRPAQRQSDDQKYGSYRRPKQDGHGRGVRPRASGTLRRESVIEAAIRHGRRQAGLGRQYHESACSTSRLSPRPVRVTNVATTKRPGHNVEAEGLAQSTRDIVEMRLRPPTYATNTMPIVRSFVGSTKLLLRP